MTARERILAWLRTAPGPLSGAALAARLGCSRAAVWKHVAALRAAGHDIRGERARGYVLVCAADPLDTATLGPRLAGSWRRIEWHAEIDSTQRRARELAEAGAPEGTVVLADRQWAGRGRLGRTWFSPAGVNVLCTVILRPTSAPAALAPLPLVAGLAVADTVRAVSGRAPALKWPNDVLLDGRKVAGVLAELLGEVDRVGAVLLGVGLNVNLRAEDVPAELRQTATSIRIACGRPVDRAEVAARLLAAIEARYGRFRDGGFGTMRAEWEAASALTGQEVEVVGPGGTVAGRVRGLDADGALLLADARGRVRRAVAGEVTLRRGVGR